MRWHVYYNALTRLSTSNNEWECRPSYVEYAYYFSHFYFFLSLLLYWVYLHAHFFLPNQSSISSVLFLLISSALCLNAAHIRQQLFNIRTIFCSSIPSGHHQGASCPQIITTELGNQGILSCKPHLYITHKRIWHPMYQFSFKQGQCLNLSVKTNIHYHVTISPYRLPPLLFTENDCHAKVIQCWDLAKGHMIEQPRFVGLAGGILMYWPIVALDWMPRVKRQSSTLWLF